MVAADVRKNFKSSKSLTLTVPGEDPVRGVADIARHVIGTSVE